MRTTQLGLQIVDVSHQGVQRNMQHLVKDRPVQVVLAPVRVVWTDRDDGVQSIRRARTIRELERLQLRDLDLEGVVAKTYRVGDMPDVMQEPVEDSVFGLME